ncbi:MAG: hypothetical protein R3182_00170 [Draconibacterium sp.]|nr:hypothetical protein [Draconibacterium sp.]
MNHTVRYDEKTDVMYMESTGDLTEPDIPKIRDKIIELSEGKPYCQLIIVMSMQYKVDNRKTRELANKAFDEAGITEVAFVGGSAANRMVAKVLLKTGMIKTKGDFFKTADNAVKWLQSKR